MSRAFNALRTGDALRIDGTGYIAAGRMVLRAPDGSQWSEWLLIPSDSTPALALKENTHRWLCRDDDGLSLWTPQPMPPDLQPQTLDHGDKYLQYRVEERDSARVERIDGDVGGEAHVGASFEYAELRNGQRRMALEWDARGAAMTQGRKIGEHDLIAWSRGAGSDLAQRPSAAYAAASGSARTVSSGETTDKSSPLAMVGIGVAMVMAMIVGSCDDDCYRRTNPITQQVETVCDDDGMRVRNDGRRYRGWNGK